MKRRYNRPNLALTFSLAAIAALNILLGSAGAQNAPDCVAVPSGLVSWWSAESDAGDSVGTNNGSLQGDVSIAPGKVGNGFQFSGSGFVLIPNSPSLCFSNELTIEMWYKSMQTADVYYGMIAKRSSANANYGINVAPGGRGLGVYYEDPSVRDGDDIRYGSGAEVSRYSPAPGPGAFHHLGATFKQMSTNQVRLETYLDGQLIRTKFLQGNLSNTLNTVPVTIGASTQAEEYFVGIIDEVSIYNRVLSGPEILAIYQADSAGKCHGPTAPHIFVQPSDQTVYAGNPATFSVIAGGTPDLTYQWKLDGTNLPSATGAELVVTNAQPSLSGPYTVAITNAYGGILSEPAYVTFKVLDVRLLPELTVEGPLGSNVEIDYSTDVRLGWTFLTNIVLTASPYRFIDYEAPFPKNRFYRAKFLP